MVGSSALFGGVLLAVALWPRHRGIALPSDPWATAPTFTEADVEAAARMLASENPRGRRALHIEQIHTQLRSRKPGQSLFERITAGSGFGPQGDRRAGGGARPVSTENEATPSLRALAREVLDGLHPSQLPGARKFFEPAQQDRALAVATQARAKQAAGLPLTAHEGRLLRYRKSAADLRKSWIADGAKPLATIDGVEFFT
jgi:hypothetical protein